MISPPPRFVMLLEPFMQPRDRFLVSCQFREIKSKINIKQKSVETAETDSVAIHDLFEYFHGFLEFSFLHEGLSDTVVREGIVVKNFQTCVVECECVIKSIRLMKHRRILMKRFRRTRPIQRIYTKKLFSAFPQGNTKKTIIRINRDQTENQEFGEFVFCREYQGDESGPSDRRGVKEPLADGGADLEKKIRCGNEGQNDQTQ